MALFDYLNKAQEKIDELQKKAETLTAKLESNPAAAVTALLKERPKKAGAAGKAKTAKAKRGPSIKDISKQIMKQRDSMRQNGFTKYTFIANRGCCDRCAALNGKHFQIARLRVGVNAPPMHDGCRCSISAYEGNSDYEAWLDHLDKGGSTADWKKQKKKK